MCIKLIKESRALQAIAWGVIAIFILKYLPPLIIALK